MESRPCEHGRCEFCGKEIIWIPTKDELWVPCDISMVEYEQRQDGGRKFILFDGTVVRGERFEKTSSEYGGYAFEPHWQTCEEWGRGFAPEYLESIKKIRESTDEKTACIYAMFSVRKLLDMCDVLTKRIAMYGYGMRDCLPAAAEEFEKAAIDVLVMLNVLHCAVLSDNARAYQSFVAQEWKRMIFDKMQGRDLNENGPWKYD